MSFAVFLPVSLAYRRWIRQYVVATSAGRSFLVIGGGATAARFYEAYRKSPNGQQLEFVDVNEERAGQPIAGQGSPIVQGNLAAKLNNLGKRYSGIILAAKASSLSTELLERLVHAQFQETRVYTLESFYETQWRYLPLDIIDPFWPLQSGFQLARISPYHYLKRLFDTSASAIALIVCAPLFCLSLSSFGWRMAVRSFSGRNESAVTEDGSFFSNSEQCDAPMKRTRTFTREKAIVV